MVGNAGRILADERKRPGATGVRLGPLLQHQLADPSRHVVDDAVMAIVLSSVRVARRTPVVVSRSPSLRTLTSRSVSDSPSPREGVVSGGGVPDEGDAVFIRMLGPDVR